MFSWLVIKYLIFCFLLQIWNAPEIKDSDPAYLELEGYLKIFRLCYQYKLI